MEHILASLTHLFSFDHSQCDVILQARQIEVVNTYDPGKSPGWRDSVYFGFWWILIWEIAVVASSVYYWRRSGARAFKTRFVLTPMAIGGAYILFVQLSAMADYSDRCRSILPH